MTEKDDDQKQLPTNKTKPIVPWIIMLSGLALLALFYFVTLPA